MDNAIPERHQLHELICKLNKSSVNHCKQVKLLQEVGDDTMKSVTEFHDLLLDIDKLDQGCMSLEESKLIYRAIEAFKLSFIYYRSFEDHRDSLCNMISNMQQLKCHHRRSIHKLNVVSNESDVLESNEETYQVEPMADRKSDNLGGEPTVIDSSVESSWSPNDYHSCGKSPSNLNMEGKQTVSQCSSSISVGDNVDKEKMELQQQLAPECGSSADSPLKMSTDLAAAQSSLKKRSSSDASIYNALGYGCAREMPFSKKLIINAKGNDFLKKFTSVTPTNGSWMMPILPKAYAISSPRMKTSLKELSAELTTSQTANTDRKSRTSSPANGYDSLDKCSPSIQVPPTPDSYQMNLDNMIDSSFSLLMKTSPEKLSAESAQPAATTTSGAVLDSASAIHGSGDELNNGSPLTQSSIDTNGCHFSVTVPGVLANSLKPAASLTEEVAAEELSSSVSPDEPMSHGDIGIVYDKMAGQRLSQRDVADIPLPPAKKARLFTTED